MNLLDIVITEFIAIVEFLSSKIDVDNNSKIMIDSNIFYKLLDKNLYIRRKEKLNIYRTLNFIISSKDSTTYVAYDKITKKTKRQVAINYTTFEILKYYSKKEVKKDGFIS